MPVLSRVAADKILRAAGFQSPAQKIDGGNWRLWSAISPTPLRDIEEEILFLGHATTEYDLKQARDNLRGQVRFPELLVVARNSIRLDEARIRSVLQVKHVITVADLLSRVLGRVLGDFAARQADRGGYGIQYFVEPDVRLPDVSVDEPGASAIEDWLMHRPEVVNNLSVLLAPGGNGKTTLANELFLRLQRRGKYPLLIERGLWRTLLHSADLSLQTIFMRGFAEQYPEVILGAEHFETFLACGAICIIFDGLDELCSRFPGEFAPSDTVEQLIALFSDARTLVTSRDLFWEDRISNGTRAKAYSIELRPFTEPQREKYVEQRLGRASERATRAAKIFDRLRQQTRPLTASISEACVKLEDFTEELVKKTEERIDLVPYVVMLATESADTEDNTVLNTYGRLLDSEDPLQGLVLSICGREKTRNHSSRSAEDQFKIFKILATELGDELAASDIAMAMPDDMQPGELESFTKHTFFKQTGSETVSYRFPFLPDYLIAREVVDWFRGIPGSRAAALDRIESRSGLAERCSELIRADVGEKWLEIAKDRWNSIRGWPSRESGFMHLLLRLSSKLGHGLRTEAAGHLLEIVGDSARRSLRELRFRGPLNGLDLRGILFDKCEFTDLELTNCICDEATIFNKCNFNGQLHLGNNDDFQMARFEESIFSVHARSSIQRELGRSRRLPITPEQVIAWVTDTLRRFRRGKFGFVTRKQEGVRRSMRQVTQHVEAILDELVGQEILVTFVNNSDGMFKIGKSNDVYVFLENGSAIGSIKRVIDRLEAKLCDPEMPRVR